MLQRARLLLRLGGRCTVRSAAAAPNTCRLRRLAVRAYSNQATFARCALSVRDGPASGIALTATHTPIEATVTAGGGSSTTTQAPLTVHLVPALDDNYTFLVEAEGGRRFVVDPAEPAPVLAALEALGWVGTVDAVLITHHHHDHVGGTLAVKEQCGRSRDGGGSGGEGDGCVVIGPVHHAASPGSEPIPGLDYAVGEGDDLALLPVFAGAPPAAVPRVLATPGHTLDHLSFVFDGGPLAAGPALFCGDTLFSLGCGRLFEGTADAMFKSLGKLRALPGSTAVYCGHEYTESNAVFAMDLLLRQGQFPGASTDDGPAQAPDAAVPRLLVPRRASEVLGLRRLGLPTLPVSLCDELAANPFLRARTVGELAAVRARKDAFRPTETLEALVDAVAGATAPAATP